MPMLKFTPDHEWLSVDGDIATVGITSYAQEQLGDVVFVELPAPGKQVTKGAAAAVVESGGIVAGNVGDSRVYLWRNGKLRQLTDDHSWVGEQIRAGVLTESDARRHPWRNVVTRALSGGEDPDVDITAIDVQPGDRLLLCSDGLSGVVPPEKLESTITESASLDAACQALVDAANAAGGPDNITVEILQVDVA